jgi:spermidine synthase
VLYQGTTAHGGETIRDDRGNLIATRPQRLTYYYEGGAYDRGIQAVRTRAGGTLGRVALIGLGMGALSCASKPGEAWSYYELDPMSAAIARDRALFRSLSLCAPQAPVVIGDGRLTLRQAMPGFDLLILDVFSSDSVPIHMLTREAFALYKSRLAPHGAIAINITNKNMELANAVAAAAAANGMVTAVNLDRHQQDASQATLHFRAEIALVARSLDDMKALKLGPDWHVLSPRPDAAIWTDDYSNVLGAMLLKMRE